MYVICYSISILVFQICLGHLSTTEDIWFDVKENKLNY